MISYEELYNGSLKRIGIIVKRRNQATGDYYMVTKVITINVDPRWRTGERIIRENAGDELEDGTYNTLVFEIQERPHYLFTRVEDNLRINVCISIPEAAIGFKRYYNLLDERILDIEKGGQLTFSDKEHRIRGEGMVNPVTGNRGDLIVRFEVMRAVYFTAEQTQ
ncbi:hypothetical protein G6F56_008421 [Rhizopus delemar]|nr:hypothetical protein G6F56_008421 [Rhizopus delemar]